jgi:hypothetical protein
MKQAVLDELTERFENLVQPYFSGDPEADEALLVKKAHTLRVRSNARRIAAELALPAAQRRLAEGMALYHDFGRFEQYRRYGTFDDAVSCNHGHLSVRQVAANGLFRLMERSERALVAKAIAFHNALALPAEEDRTALLFMQMLRDADKIDILGFFSAYLSGGNGALNPAMVLGLRNEPYCSGAPLAALNAGRMVRKETLQTVFDFVLLQISWVFDLNLAPSKRMLREEGHLERLASLLPDEKPVQRAAERALAALNAEGGGYGARGWSPTS